MFDFAKFGAVKNGILHVEYTQAQAQAIPRENVIKSSHIHEKQWKLIELSGVFPLLFPFQASSPCYSMFNVHVPICSACVLSSDLLACVRASLCTLFKHSQVCQRW